MDLLFIPLLMCNQSLLHKRDKVIDVMLLVAADIQNVRLI